MKVIHFIRKKKKKKEKSFQSFNPTVTEQKQTRGVFLACNAIVGGREIV